MGKAILVVIGLAVGALVGAGGVLVLSENQEASRPAIYCPIDVRQIADAYAVSGNDTSLFADCQEDTGGEFPLEDATLAPEYRCTVEAQIGTFPYQLICEPQ